MLLTLIVTGHVDGVWVTVKHVLYVIVTPCLLSICSLCYVMYFLYSILNIEKYSPEMRLIMIGLLVVAVKQLYGQDLRGIAGNEEAKVIISRVGRFS